MSSSGWRWLEPWSATPASSWPMPTAELDATSRDRVLDVLMARPATVVVVTHDPDVAARFDRRLVLANGRLTAG